MWHIWTISGLAGLACAAGACAALRQTGSAPLDGKRDEWSATGIDLRSSAIWRAARFWRSRRSRRRRRRRVPQPAGCGRPSGSPAIGTATWPRPGCFLREEPEPAGFPRQCVRPTRTCRGVWRLAPTACRAAPAASAMACPELPSPRHPSIRSTGQTISGGRNSNQRADRLIGTAQATLTQPLYTGGKTQANVNRAKNQVMAERATLIAQEQTSFTNTVNAYVGVIQAQQLLALNINNEQVLAKQLQATNDRFRVGEITRTDVAQAEAALAGATAQRQTAEGNLQTARGTFQQVVGFLPPGDLVEPQPLALPVEDRAGRDGDGRQQQSAGDRRAVQRCRREGCGGRRVRPADAAGQLAGAGVPVEQRRCRATRKQRLPGRAAALGAGLSGRRRIFRRAPGAPGSAADRQAGGRCAPHRGAECGAGLGDAGRGKGLGRQHA